MSKIATNGQVMVYRQKNSTIEDTSPSVEKLPNHEDSINLPQPDAASINQHSMSSNYQVEGKYALDTQGLPSPAGAKFHLPSPTAAAVRDYFHSHMPSTPIRHSYLPHVGLSPAPRSFKSAHVGRAMPSPIFKSSSLNSPRRNSLSQSALTSPLARLIFSPSPSPTPTTSTSWSNQRSPSPQNSPSATIFVLNGAMGNLASDNRAILLRGVRDPRTSTYTPIQRASTQPIIQNPLEPRHLGSLPFDFTHQRLQQWGAVYMANSETADALVIAVPLSRSPPAPASDSTHLHHPQESSESAYQVRARILPRDSMRKPLVITKKFPQRSASVTSKTRPTSTKPASPAPHGAVNSLRRHSSLQERQMPRRSHRLQQTPTSSTSPSGSRHDSVPSASHPAHGVHIEYAVHSLPVLAAILLSGHVHKGDAVEVTMPHPQLWGKVVEWMYTGRLKGWGGGVEAFWDVIRFLGGNAQEENEMVAGGKDADGDVAMT